MALIITTPITTNEGFTVETSYARVAATDDYSGLFLVSSVSIYKSLEAFEAGDSRLNIAQLNTFASTPYNREVDGTDILAIAHTKLQALLAEQGIQSTIELGN